MSAIALDFLHISPSIVAKHIAPTAEALHAFFDVLPASETHHDSELFGLWKHTMKVVDRVNNQLESTIFCTDRRCVGLDKEEQEDVWRSACILAALLHDAGKAIYDIRSWSDDFERFPFSQTPIQGFKWNQKRIHKNHEFFSVFLAGIVIPKETLIFLHVPDPKPFEDMILAISGKETSSPVRNLLVNADSSSVAAAMQIPMNCMHFEPSLSGNTPEALIEELRRQVIRKEGSFLASAVLQVGDELRTSAQALDRIVSSNPKTSKHLIVGLLKLAPEWSLKDGILTLNPSIQS